MNSPNDNNSPALTGSVDFIKLLKESNELSNSTALESIYFIFTRKCTTSCKHTDPLLFSTNPLIHKWTKKSISAQRVRIFLSRQTPNMKNNPTISIGAA